MSEPPKVLLFGLGAIGSCYGYFLSSNCHITAICRSNYDTVKTRGVSIESVKHGSVHYTPDKVVQSTIECQDTDFDYILVTTKAFPGRISIVKDLEKVVVPKTVIVLIQNGIGIEQEIAEAFPENELVSGVVYLPCQQMSAGQVVVKGEDVLELGHFPSKEPSAKLKRFADILGKTAKVTLFDDIQVKRWKKMIINASWNPIAALSLCTDAEFLQTGDFTVDVVRDTMNEVLSIAKHLGLDLTEKDIDIQLARATERAKTNSGITMSMLADVQYERALEAEALVGNAVKIALEANIPVPNLRMLYVLARARDHKIREGKA